VPITVRHQDGTVERKQLVAKKSSPGSLREFGIAPPRSLTIASIEQPKVLQERTKLLPGDRIVAVDGTKIAHAWEFDDVVGRMLTPTIKITAERKTADGPERVETELPLDWPAAKNGEIDSNDDLTHVYSMVPRLRVAGVADAKAKNGAEPTQRLRVGDIIVAAETFRTPPTKELREITENHEARPAADRLANGCQRRGTDGGGHGHPRQEQDTSRIVIGFAPGAGCAARGCCRYDIRGRDCGPGDTRGAGIVSVNEKPVASFYDVVREVRQWGHQPVTLRYQRWADGGRVT
jgi:hypothetical protein